MAKGYFSFPLDESHDLNLIS